LIKKLKSIKNLKSYLIIYILLMSILIFFLVSGKNWLFFLEYYSFGFFNGYSQSKFLWFFVLLGLILGYNFFTKKMVNKKNKIRKNKTLDKFNKFFEKIISKKFNLVIFVLFIILTILSLSSQLVFLSYNNFDLFNLSYLIYDDSYKVFTGTSITHIHTFKPIIGVFAPLFNVGDFDFAQTIPTFMPEWFSLIYILGFILLTIFVIFLVKKSESFFKEKNIDWLNLFLFICSSFLLTKSIIDGGPLTTEFLVGTVYLIYTLFFYKKEKKYFYFLFLSALILVIDFCIRYSVVINAVKTLTTEQLITLALKGIITVSGLLLFVLVFGLILTGIFEIIYSSFTNKKFLLKNYFSKKKIVAIIFVLLFFVSFIYLFEYFKIEKAVKEESILELEKTIPAFTQIGYISYAVKNNDFVTISDSSRELVVGETKKDTSIQELSVWPKNIKSKDYIFVWKESCSIPIVRKLVYVKTNQEFAPLNSNSMIFVLREKKLSNNNYSIDFLHPSCIVDVRALIVEYLKKRGITEFIVYS